MGQGGRDGGMIVQNSELENAWPAARGFVASALDHSFYETPDTLLRELCAGRAQLWAHGDGRGYSVTRMIHVKQKALQVVAFAGRDMTEWVSDAVAEWEAFAQSNDCAMVVAVGRPGWKREFGRNGFEVTNIIGTKKVAPCQKQFQ